MEDSEYLLCLLILVAIARLSPITQGDFRRRPGLRADDAKPAG
jgi:hypothetical protein